MQYFLCPVHSLHGQESQHRLGYLGYPHYQGDPEKESDDDYANCAFILFVPWRQEDQVSPLGPRKRQVNRPIEHNEAMRRNIPFHLWIQGVLVRVHLWKTAYPSVVFSSLFLTLQTPLSRNTWNEEQTEKENEKLLLEVANCTHQVHQGDRARRIKRKIDVFNLHRSRNITCPLNPGRPLSP